ncbi:RNA ligase family protein [bacterium]|nr:RNA ligase family protein [bacterium]
MANAEFKAWEKIPRDNPFTVTISEKMDGTNACVIIQEGVIIGVQSRKRLITQEDDNYGFAAWVFENETDLLSLGDGYHYGEWAGIGIQKNPHALDSKKFFLFNTFRWNENNPNRPKCCEVVKVLFQGELKPETIPNLLEVLKEGAGEGETPEGVVAYYHAFRKYTKHTIKSPNGKWHK